MVQDSGEQHKPDPEDSQPNTIHGSNSLHGLPVLSLRPADEPQTYRMKALRPGNLAFTPRNSSILRS